MTEVGCFLMKNKKADKIRFKGNCRSEWYISIEHFRDFFRIFLKLLWQISRRRNRYTDNEIQKKISPDWLSKLIFFIRSAVTAAGAAGFPEMNVAFATAATVDF